MTASPVILILGAGSRVGRSTARAFAAQGYKVALAARSVKEADNTADEVHIPADLSDPAAVPDIFRKVKALLGIPSVVVYNAASAHLGPVSDPLRLPVADFARSLAVNTTSAYAAAQQALLGFRQLPASASRTFIFTGNKLNTVVFPQLLDLGVGKSATAHFIEAAAMAYQDAGFKFYYADERRADGAPVYDDVNGDGHASLYVSLAEGRSQGPWQQTFVSGEGYKDFSKA